MSKIKSTFLIFIFFATAVILPNDTFADKKDRVKRDFRAADENDDDKLSRDEWMRRGNFDLLDKNGDGSLSLKEVREIYKGHDQRDYHWPPNGLSKRKVEIDQAVTADRIGKDDLDDETICGIARLKRCNIDSQIKRGLIATGTGPIFPENSSCPGIDDYWAMDYASKRNRQTYHGGIDLPAPWGEPMRAVADGSVVAKYPEELSKRGNEVVLRHSPEQTGLPMWTYSAYGHLDTLPDFQIGQKLMMGDIIGPTGNSGISAKGQKGSGQSTTRRPAIHLAMFYSSSEKYSEVNNTVVPKDGFWLDPMAFYRQKGPFDSLSVKGLEESEKDVLIPVLLEDGRTKPLDTKVIWPYTCK